MSSSPSERRFAVPGLSLAAREWGGPQGRPVIALHGWLDNAASFDRLAPLLTDLHLLALDCAGHGRSDFRSPDSSYHIWQDIGEVLAVADQMGWAEFSVLGHSRGAGIAMLLAASHPERIRSLVCIEGGIPVPGAAAEAPANLAQALRDRAAFGQDSGRIFPSREHAIEERARGVVAISYAAAEILARRGLVEVATGWQWRADRRLKGRSELRLTPELIGAFVAQVIAPVLLIEGQDSALTQRPIYRELLGRFPRLSRVALPGGHHLHLEGAEQAIAAQVQDFLQEH